MWIRNNRGRYGPHGILGLVLIVASGGMSPRHCGPSPTNQEPIFFPMLEGYIGERAQLAIYDLPNAAQLSGTQAVKFTHDLAVRLGDVCVEWIQSQYGLAIASGEGEAAHDRAVVRAGAFVQAHAVSDATPTMVELLVPEVVSPHVEAAERFIICGRYDNTGKYEPETKRIIAQPFYSPFQVERSPLHYQAFWTDGTRLDVRTPVFAEGTYVGELTVTFEISSLGSQKQPRVDDAAEGGRRAPH